MKIYMAGSLFSEGEQASRVIEGTKLRTVITDLVNKSTSGANLKQEDIIGSVVFNPIENPFNDKSTLPVSEDIYGGDKAAIDSSSIFFFNLDNITDAGVFMELGQVLEKMNAGKEIYIYPVISDMRAGTAGEYDALRVPWGFNQYVIGGLLSNNIDIFNSFDDALSQFVSDHLEGAFFVDGRVTFEGEMPETFPVTSSKDVSFSDGDKILVYANDGGLHRYLVAYEEGNAWAVRRG